ncbi:1-acyl-sn-glycerol-3-phosphate acyltransferase [Spongiibacter sp. KMU-158]|uniref:1-acyl-sn-glycerol-3-phosphate acyltransferase n=1 Tax=Spongiibacter pelagi TaxID=2760804 RepID=A0A927BXY0_9GAMM|nr:lysophospholipid acyltransferase family protein [Spongiibacter pelagi]MBD2857595.1 1-acyl-sn-glycerol-3-phosphate acyltransferase [Spongiibacter pelagi]
MLITFFFSVTGILLSPLLGQYNTGRYFVIGNFLIMKWLRLCCGVKLVVEGQLPTPNHPYVVIVNHQSQWETFFLQWFLYPVATVLKKELLSIPFFGHALKTMQAIGIDRSKPREAIKQTLEQGIDRLDKGYNLLIFPEGTRSPHGQLGNFARGGANIAIRAEKAIIPIAHNAGKCWPSKSRIIYPGTVTLVVGQPVATADRDPRAITQEIQDWIAEQCQRIG